MGEGPQQAGSVVAFGQPAPVPRAESEIHCLTVIGQIEGHVVLPARNKTTKYEHVIPQLIALEQSTRVKGLLIILNTVGGDIEAGLALAEMIRSLSKPTVSLVLGGGHSIGLPIAVAADYSFVAETATITVHPIRLTGLVIGVPQTYEYLDKMQDRVIRFIVTNSRISEAALREMMFRTGELVRDVGTVLIGRDAVQAGLIDQVGGVVDALAKLRDLIQWHQRLGYKPTKAARQEVMTPPAWPAAPTAPMTPPLPPPAALPPLPVAPTPGWGPV